VRICALGNLQREGFDYDQTFAPVARSSTIKMLLGLAAHCDWPVHQMDVDTAFLYGELPSNTPIYLQVPLKYPIPEHLRHIPREKLVAKLNKSVYGLKQSPRLWNENIHKTMTSKGFIQSFSDPCLYHRIRGNDQLYVCIYVDDLIIAGSSLVVLNLFKDELKSVYNMKDLGELQYCLGIEVERNWGNSTITLRQTKYIMDMLNTYSPSECHSEPIPFPQGLQLSKSMSPVTSKDIATAELFPYREIVG
jgi:hypothetical protein